MKLKLAYFNILILGSSCVYGAGPSIPIAPDKATRSFTSARNNPNLNIHTETMKRSASSGSLHRTDSNSSLTTFPDISPTTINNCPSFIFSRSRSSSLTSSSSDSSPSTEGCPGCWYTFSKDDTRNNLPTSPLKISSKGIQEKNNDGHPSIEVFPQVDVKKKKRLGAEKIYKKED